ncbi:MAG TPA: L-rhamnose isomerase [Verrucomicrobiae bacterium]|nr:L-rhamnose isomerase [Verrucomicrobiae bacterium]
MGREIESAFRLAKARYADCGVDAERAMERLARISISLQCWQGDDVTGFERAGESLGGGLAVTGNYPGKARTPGELRADAEAALRLIPGKHRFNLHACYAESSGRRVERDELEAKDFQGWIEWAQRNRLGLDFNPTFFSHPKAADGFTLSHPDRGIRRFWIDHGIACRNIGAAIGRALGKTCVTNFWIPDGFKDTPADRRAPRERLVASLDAIFQKMLPPKFNLDAVEPKLFGIGSESYVVGSHEFYFGYAITRRKLLTLDTGHFHPTESVADKISSALLFLPEILVHASRGVRWDSDHVVVLSDELRALAREIIANGYENRVRIGLDYFDASINRVAAWVIGTRAMLQSLLIAILEPSGIREAEKVGDYTTRLALQEEAKTLPFGAVWDAYCERNHAPPGERWIAEVKRYEREVLSRRD